MCDWEQVNSDLPPGSAHGVIRHQNLLSGPLFLYHAESESPAVWVLVNSCGFH